MNSDGCYDVISVQARVHSRHSSESWNPWIPDRVRYDCIHALLSTIAPALFYLRPSMGSYLLHLTHMDVENAEDCMEPSPPCSRSPA